jgi:predicted transcriptional regulator
MPTVRKTPQRTVGVDDELWQKAQRKARRRREKVSDVLRRALVEYVDDEDDPREAGEEA